MPSFRLAAGLAGGLAGGLAVVVLTAGPAAAHVTVSSPDAAPGGFGKLVVRVPTESDTASTTRLQVQLPADTPFAFVSTRPHPGWTVATTERKLADPITAEGFTLSKAVATVTWTVSDATAGIAPGQFDEFELSLGAFPSDVDTLSFPTTQTYSDGTVVTWDQASVEGQDEPEHPVPTLELATATQAADVTVPDTDASDGTALWLGGTALVVAAAGLVLAGLSALGVVGRRRPPA
jgi:periplasmic copper chaperone A